MQFWRLAVGTSTIVDVRRLKVKCVPTILKHSVYERNPFIPLPFFLCSFPSCVVLTVYIDFKDI